MKLLSKKTSSLINRCGLFAMLGIIISNNYAEIGILTWIAGGILLATLIFQIVQICNRYRKGDGKRFLIELLKMTAIALIVGVIIGCIGERKMLGSWWLYITMISVGIICTVNFIWEQLLSRAEHPDISNMDELYSPLWGHPDSSASDSSSGGGDDDDDARNNAADDDDDARNNAADDATSPDTNQPSENSTTD